MTNDELSELLTDCPTLYHMAERESWASIQAHGLLSTSALLDLFAVSGEARHAIEAVRRPQTVRLTDPRLGTAVVRDQKPMDDRGLLRCLQDGLCPQDWYRMLNRKVFFWLTRDRLHRLLTARPYRDVAHDVLEIDACALVRAHAARIALSPINSGATKPFGAPRGRSTFLPIAEYPYSDWCHRRKRGERVVELAVEGGVQGIARFVRQVVIMRGADLMGDASKARQDWGRRAVPPKPPVDA